MYKMLSWLTLNSLIDGFIFIMYEDMISIRNDNIIMSEIGVIWTFWLGMIATKYENITNMPPI